MLYLWERECSIQRRHQKVLEEAPSPFLDEATRHAMGKQAVALAKAVNYRSAGTVEFVVGADRKFYFLEMNTRLQVEHPVTEMITGIDIVQQQIHIAAGGKLAFRQRDIEMRGHAIECRINAEDPLQNFRPSPGKIEHMTVPGGWGVRFDSHAHAGYTISPRYDSMIGKLIVHRPTRDEAVAAMRRCLDEIRVDPIHTTIPLFKRIMQDETFISGKFDTGYVERLKLGEAVG